MIHRIYQPLLFLYPVEDRHYTSSGPHGHKEGLELDKIETWMLQTKGANSKCVDLII